MAKTRPGKRDLDSYTIRGTNKIVRGKKTKIISPFSPTHLRKRSKKSFLLGIRLNGTVKYHLGLSLIAERFRFCLCFIMVLCVCVFFMFFYFFGVFLAVGDCVLMRPSDTTKPPYVARVEKIESDSRNNVKVRVRWYYRPEESIGGRRQFHGAKELFLSDHYDIQSAHTIEGKCVVHSFKNYTKLENVGAEDYYCRFEYKAATGAFTPDRVAV